MSDYRKYTGKGKCESCGGPTKVKPSYRTVFYKYCSRLCHRRSYSNSEVGVAPCPVKSCKGELRRSNIATCSSCWPRIPKPLRTRLVTAWESYRLAGTSELEAALAHLNEVREEAVAAAGGHLAVEQLERKRRARRRARQRALAA